MATAVDGQLQETAIAGAVRPESDDAEQQQQPQQNVTAPTQHRPSTRVLAPDLLRGLLMVLQAIDHCALSVGAWQHGLALESEADGIRVHEWNGVVGWSARMLTHLCAPGFSFLLGMGIVYLGQSRTKLGWSPLRLVRHFALRCGILLLLNQLVITLPLVSRGYWVVNPVLLALAINYLLAGLIWLGLNALESTLAHALDAWTPEDPERRPLLGAQGPKSKSGSDIAWHVHNAVLVGLTAAAAWLNVWMSPHHGHCIEGSPTDSAAGMQLRYGIAIDIWFYPVLADHIMSGFPPLAWLSFSLLGLLYGRIATARAWRPRSLSAGTAAAGIALLILFVLTRLLHFGNLTEDCMQMAEHLAHPQRNQYLASFRAFFYIAKYPPSVAFFAFTMGINLILLAAFGLLSPRVARSRALAPLLVFGTSALFFYLLHMWLYQLLGIPGKALFGHETDRKDPMSGKPAIATGPGAVMWVTWSTGLLILYPLCRWYGAFKSRKGPDSIWRFF